MSPLRARVTSAASSITGANASAARHVRALFADHTTCDRRGAPWVTATGIARAKSALRPPHRGRQRGDNDKAEQAQNELPDQVDTERDSGMLDRLGIDPQDLLGGAAGKLGL